ncbi:SRPBCC domain-containing protein [Micromonospora sp. MA102]|uniref:SRPBCC domain-containing protein n=1 Tax=Micromonospora sp. MA102 TaxID=2952755 RepID=UPI0021C99AE5|nr:SRPBCC domain-containing protein [Micromonospora sp. MA102]
MTETRKTSTQTTTQVYRVYIKASQQAVWDAITRPEWTQRYGYRVLAEYDLRPGGAYRAVTSEDMRTAGAVGGFEVPDVGVDGEVIEADPPHKLVQTWRMLMDPQIAAEGFTRLTHEIEVTAPGVTRLTVIHELEGAPKLAELVAGQHEAEGAGGGWNWVLSGLKSLLETDTPLPH